MGGVKFSDSHISVVVLLARSFIDYYRRGHQFLLEKWNVTPGNLEVECDTWKPGRGYATADL